MSRYGVPVDADPDLVKAFEQRREHHRWFHAPTLWIAIPPSGQGTKFHAVDVLDPEFTVREDRFPRWRTACSRDADRDSFTSAPVLWQQLVESLLDEDGHLPWHNDLCGKCLDGVGNREQRRDQYKRRYPDPDTLTWDEFLQQESEGW